LTELTLAILGENTSGWNQLNYECYWQLAVVQSFQKNSTTIIKTSSQYLLPATMRQGRPPLRETLKQWTITLLGIVIFIFHVWEFYEYRP